MARFLLVLALCVASAVVVSAARPARNPFEVVGRVYCDSCRAGFETSKSTYIAGAKVRVECRSRQSMELVYSKEGTTDSTGTYKIHVDEDHQDELCDALLVSSPHAKCNIPSAGRDRARLVLTRNNGIVSDNRFANNMGFETEEIETGCAEVLRQYQELDD